VVVINTVESPQAVCVVAALSVSGPVFRMDMARARSLVPELRGACVEISRAVRG
jgi:DNA-binding IclR family transcriptional regulator